MCLAIKMAVLTLSCILTLISLGSSARECVTTDYHPEFTECDSEKGRWRVWVPKADCEGGAPAPYAPERYPNCDMECDPGKYLDVYKDLKCKPCPAGSYSLGVMQRFDNWTTEWLNPSLFNITVRPYLYGAYSPSRISCSNQGWTIDDNRLIVSLSDICTSELTYSAKMSRAGHVRFTYQYTDSSVNFGFQASSNGQCSNAEEGAVDFQPAITNSSDLDHFETHSVWLPAGVNFLSWTVSRYAPSSWGSGRLPGWQAPQVRIGMIELEGLSFVPQCTFCPPGTFSTGGNSSCAPCPANTFARRGASVCTSCSDDEYAEPGSSACRKRPLCNEQHYFVRPGVCANGTAEQRADWIMPHLCRGGVALPTFNKRVSCRLCNPGMMPRAVNNSLQSTCEFCPADKPYSDGETECQRCAANTVPQLGIAYHWFYELPPNVHTQCVSSNGDRCPQSAVGWQPAGSYLQTTPLYHDGSIELADFFQPLTLHVNKGFIAPDYRPSDPNTSPEYARLTVELEVQCTKGHNCSLSLTESRMPYTNLVINEWKQTVNKLTYSYVVRSPTPVSFTFVFNYNATPTSFVNETTSVARIYSIVLSNVQGAGATECKRCGNAARERCVPCPDGSYMQTDGSCARCPPNSVSFVSKLYMLQDVPRGIEACIACGSGLRPDASGSRCVLDCSKPLPIGANRTLDLRSFTGVHTVASPSIFAPQGLLFHYLLNFTICEHDSIVRCVLPRNDSRPFVHSALGMLAQPDDEDVHFGQHACYVTVLPDYFRPSSSKNVGRSRSTTKRPTAPTDGFVSPLNLGEAISHILVPGADKPVRANLSARFVEAGFQAPQSDTDVFVVYQTIYEANDICPEGRYLVLMLRCDNAAPLNASDAIQLPPACPEGTCDGCIYMAMWRSRAACHVCDLNTDVHTVVGECIRGKQTVYYQPASHCYLHDASLLTTRTEIRACPYLPLEAYIALGVAALLLVTVLIIACVYRSKTKKLEHKYMRLVQQSGDQYGGELAGAESCAVQEGELDESGIDDESMLSRHKMSKKQRYNGKDTTNDEADTAADEDEINVNFRNMKLRPMTSESGDGRATALSRILGRLKTNEDRGSSLMAEDDDV